MIQHDEAFELLARAPIKTTDVEVVKQISDIYGYYDDTPYWTSSDLLMSVNIDIVGAFLGAATKKATVKLLGLIDTAAAGDVFQVRLGLKDGTFNYISQGFYIVDTVEIDYDSGYTVVTMYDHMKKAADSRYTDTQQTYGFSFPATVEDTANRVATAIDTELMQSFSELPNAGYEILVDPYANIANLNLRDIIKEIAEVTGTTAIISDTTLVFRPFEITRGELSG